VEILSPEEYNTLIDALNELDSRSPKKFNCGSASFNGDGVSLSFKIAHGIGTTPSFAIVGKKASGLPDIDYWDVDTTYITVYFKSPPPSGTGNVVLWWLAILV
jgi:hypothetical protein